MKINKEPMEFEEKAQKFMDELLPKSMSNWMNEHISVAQDKLNDWAYNSPAIKILSEELFKSHGVALNDKIVSVCPSTHLVGIIFISDVLKYENSPFMIHVKIEMKHTPLARDDYVEEAKGIIIEFVIEAFDAIKERLDDETMSLSEGELIQEDDV
jgi:hypothetical protein